MYSSSQEEYERDLNLDSYKSGIEHFSNTMKSMLMQHQKTNPDNMSQETLDKLIRIIDNLKQGYLDIINNAT